MLRNVFTKTLWDQRRGIVVWAIAIAAVGVVYAAFYPTMNTPEMLAALEAYPEGFLEALGMTDITSPEGYLGSTTYGLLGPALILIFGIAFGSGAIAGEEEAGRLDTLLAHPVERWEVVVHRAAAMLLALALAGVALWLAMAATAGPAEFESIGLGNLAAASAQLVLLGAVFGALALTLGAATGRRAISLAVAGVVAVLAYLANNLGPSVDVLAWTQDVSPFFYYNGGQPLRNGLQVGDSLILAATVVALVAIAVVGFRRRDVAV